MTVISHRALTAGFVAAATIGLTIGFSVNPANATTPDPVTVTATAGDTCGTATVAVTGAFLEFYRADLAAPGSEPTWMRQPSQGRTSFTLAEAVPGPYVQYSVVTLGTDRVSSGVVEVAPCIEPTPSPTATQTAGPTPTAEPTPTEPPAPSPTPEPTSPAPTTTPTPDPTATPAKDAHGGLAKTGADR